MTTERDIINQIDYARQEGRKEGREEGMAAGVLASAKAMLEHGMSADEVKVILKLSDEELAPLL